LRLHESVGICTRASIEPERWLVKVAERVERFDAEIRPAQHALEQRPKVFNSVGVNVTANVFFGLIDHAMDMFFELPF